MYTSTLLQKYFILWNRNVKFQVILNSDFTNEIAKILIHLSSYAVTPAICLSFLITWLQAGHGDNAFTSCHSLQIVNKCVRLNCWVTIAIFV